MTLGDQPSEMAKFTPYTGKGESYRLDPVCGDIADALSQDRRSKKLDRDATAEYLAKRYARIIDETKTWSEVFLTQEARGFGNVLEESIKKCLQTHPSVEDDAMYSYFLGKLDSKWLAQCGLVAMRGNGIVSALGDDCKFSKEIRLHDAAMAWQRIKVVNWYVRGVINTVHHAKDLKVRPVVELSLEDKMHAAIVVIMKKAAADGKIDAKTATAAVKAKLTLKTLGNSDAILPVLHKMSEYKLLEQVEVRGGEMKDAASNPVIEKIGAGTRERLPTIVVKRKWGNAVDRSVRQCLERHGLTMED